MIDKAKTKAEKVIDIAKARSADTVNGGSATDDVVSPVSLLSEDLLAYMARQLHYRSDALNLRLTNKALSAAAMASIVGATFRPSLKSLIAAHVYGVQYLNVPNKTVTLTLHIKDSPVPSKGKFEATMRNIVFDQSSANGFVVRNVKGVLWESFLKEPPIKSLRHQDDGVDFSNLSKYMANVDRLPQLMELLGKVTKEYITDKKLESDMARYYRTSEYDLTDNTLDFGNRVRNDDRDPLGVLFVRWRNESNGRMQKTLNISIYTPYLISWISWDITIVFNATEAVVTNFLRKVDRYYTTSQFEEMDAIVPVDLIIEIVKNRDKPPCRFLEKLFIPLFARADRSDRCAKFDRVV